jgi:hypothetical protein
VQEFRCDGTGNFVVAIKPAEPSRAALGAFGIVNGLTLPVSAANSQAGLLCSAPDKLQFIAGDVRGTGPKSTVVTATVGA